MTHGYCISSRVLHVLTDTSYSLYRVSIFTFSDSLSAVKSKKIFGKITLMALEKYFLKIEENLACFGLA